jgi:hypothetical protein
LPRWRSTGNDVSPVSSRPLGAAATWTIFGLAERVPGAPAAAAKAVFNGVVVGFSPDGIPFVVTDPEPITTRVAPDRAGPVRALA